MPSEVNPLVDILLARGINGESPVKKRASRKSAVTPKPRPSTSSRAARTKTPRPGSPKRTARKSAAIPNDGDENNPPPARKRRGASKNSKLQESKRTKGALLRQVVVEPPYSSCTLCPLHALLLNGPYFISRRHRHWYCRAFSVSRGCPTEVFCRPACRRQCAPFLTST